MKKAFLSLLGLFAFIGVQAQDSPYTGSEVGEGEFYLYNVGTGLWIQNIDANNRRSDDNWNTGAGMGTAGFDFVLTAVDGGYKLDPKEAPNNMGFNYGDGGVLYLDGNLGGNTHWDFTPVTGVSNGYKITIEDKVLGVEAVDGKYFLINNATENDVWQLVTKAERLDKMQDIASADEPYDLSALMGDWNFANNNQRRSQWQEVQNGGNNDGFPRDRRWNSSHLVWNTNYYSWTQTIEGVPDGLYQFSVQGMYRDGNRNEVGAKAANGETNLIAKYFLGASEGSLMSMLAEASETQGDGFATAIENTNPQLYAPDNAGNWTVVWALHPDKYWNEPIKANVRGGSVELGVRKTSNIGGDWIAMNEFKLEYVGPVDPELDKVALQNAVAAAEAFDGVTSDVLASQLAEALENAQDLLESTTATYEDYANQADNLLQVLSAAQAVDVSVLKATAALAKTEGIDTSVADNLVANATEAGPISDALFDLRAARKVNAQAMPDIYTGSEPAEGKVYLYNLGTGLFLGTGASYNTHCAVDQVGIEIELIQDGDGFKMKTNRGSGWLAKGNAETSTYVDCPTQQVWHFIEVSEGVYNISFDGTATNLLGYNPHSQNDNNTGIFWSSIGIKREDGSDPMNQWKIITAAEREALLAEASKENPVDVSYLLPAASLNKQDTFPWVDEGDAHHAKVDNFENWAFEFWNNSSFKFSQTVENLPAGLYEISVQAFWREGDGATQVAIVNEDGALNQKAYLFANDAQELLPNIASYLDFVPGVGGDATSNKGIFPNWVNEALEYMETGAYWATVKVVVEEDGKLTLGIGCDEKAAFGDWTVIDNFRLTYLGEASDYDRALASIEDGANYRVFTEVDGEKYYLTALGVLDSKLQKAGVFNFKKVAGGQYEYGFQLTSPLNNRFTNPYNTAESSLTIGRITVTDGSRNDWEAQVFFKNAEGKYAVRGTNAKYNNETSGWSWIGNSYWTVDEGPVAEYSFDQNYVWQLEEAEADNRQEILAEVRPVVESWGKMLQDIDGLVTDASMYYANSKANESIGLPGLLDGDYDTYFHTMWGNSGVTEPHYLEATLPDAADKFYYYFVKRDPVNNGNSANRPIHIAISGSNDGETFTPITEVDDMPLTVPPVNYMSELITADQAYKIIRFTVLDTNNHATDNNGNKFFTFSEFYILPSNELVDAATALLATDYTDIPLDTEGYVEQVEEMDAILKGYFKDINLNLVLDGEVAATETYSIIRGKEAPVPAAPTSFYTNADVVSEFGGLVYFTRDVDEIAEETTEINYTAESAISESFEDAKWFNMTIRGNYWVTMDETEPYYPTEDKDLEAEASQWAFGVVEGEPNQIVVWNRAAGADMSLLSTGESDSNGKPLVAMREGQTAWDFAPNSDGFVIHQVGTGENEWVNQNGGASGPFSIWNSGYAKGDGGSVLRIYPVEVEEEEETLEIALDVDRVVGQGYTADVATVDFAEAKEFLGVEEVTSDMLYFVNPDGTEMDYATYSVSPQPDFTYDGWCDADGAAAQWGATTAICVKFFQAIPDGAYEICDMNGADEVGKTYTVKWALKANDKAVVYSINVTFVEAPVTDLTFDDLEIAQTEELDVKSELGAAYEGLTATVDIDNILATLEVESLADVTIAAVQPDGTLDLNYKLGTTDGWRDADGTWKSWTDDLEAAPYFYVKADFASEPQLYQIGGYPGHTDEAAKFTAPYVFVVNGTAKAYLLNVNLIYEEAVEGTSYEGEVDVTQSHPAMGVIGETTEEQTVTVTPAGDGLVTVTFSGFAMPMAALGSFDEFTIPNVSMTTNDDGSITYFAEGFQIPTSSTGAMVSNYNGTLEGSQESESAAPTFTVTLVNATTVVAVFNPNALEPTPEPVEFSGMIKQILSHPQTGVQGQATGEQTVTIEAGEDGKVNITYSGFTMPVTGAVLPEFTVEGVEATQNEDGSISYALPEDAEAEVVIDRGTGTVTYKVALEGTQEDGESTPVLKLTLENSVVDTVWFGADEKTIDKAIATGINGVNALGTEGTIFDLSGRKVEKIQRSGIYIVNGKKVSVK